jgi:hypothetical protein
MTKRVLIWLLVAVAILLLLVGRGTLPEWVASYNREAARVDDDLERLSQP